MLGVCHLISVAPHVKQKVLLPKQVPNKGRSGAALLNSGDLFQRVPENLMENVL
jgi:hypothetical protein